MSINRVVLQEGLLFDEIKRFNYKKNVARFIELFGEEPAAIWINENDELKCEQLIVIKKTDVVKNHYYLTKGT